MASGLTAVAAAMLVLLAERPDSSWPLTVVAVALLGTAAALILTPSSLAVLDAVDRRRSGIAAATASAARQTGTTLGVAVLGSLMLDQLASPPVPGAVTDSTGLHLIAGIAGAVAIAGALLVVAGARRR